MTFLDNVFERFQRDASATLLREIRDGQFVSVTGAELLTLVNQGRAFIRRSGLKAGDRCAVVAPNSIQWVALDLAMMAEGIIVVPLYARQSAAELSGMVRDSAPAAIFCSDQALGEEIQRRCGANPVIVPIQSVFAGEASPAGALYPHADSDPVTIIYTSGTSGEPKGVVINAGNVTHILGCTNDRLDQLMEGHQEPEQVFHYTPFCFAASWIATLSFLSRNSVLTLSTDLTKLPDELKLAAPNYFLNVPTLLERVRAKVTESIQARGGVTAKIFSHAQKGFLESRQGSSETIDRVCLSLAKTIIFPKVRKSIGPNLKALICGSAPLAIETQLFFMMLGIPVLQVYGLTETTAICTMDVPNDFEPGFVGQAIPGVEMRIAENGEIVVRGPNVFAGYWGRPGETAKALEGGWFHTGDQGEVNARGSWRVTGRLKNILVLNSGHKVAPEPVEQVLAAEIPQAQHVVLLGNQRSYLTLLLTAPQADKLPSTQVQAAIDAVNSSLPHYKQIRAFHISTELLTIENGMLTANGKLKRDAIAERFATEIEPLYHKQSA
jgi:long-chain acyl-CoA synthetase